MAQRLLKTAGKRKIAVKRPAKKTEDASVVLVGTYHEKQLDWIKKNGVYNYPVKEENDGRARTPAAPQDGNLIEFASKVKELWLYAGAKAKRHCFAAEFVGIQSKAEFLASNPTYAKKVGKPRYAQYAVFKTKPFDYGPKLEGKVVVARAIDFATGRGQTKKVAAAIRQFHADGEFAPLAAYLPKELGEVPRQQLRVCEAAVQLDFLGMVETKESESFPFPAPTKGKFTFIDLFAGIGGIRLGYQLNGGRCVFSSEWDKDAAKTYYYNFGERPHGDIQKIDPKTIPDFDILLAGFPCQPFSIIGDKEGFKHETQGTLFFNIEKILLEKRPKAFMLENVRNLTAHDNGRTFKVILSHLQDAGYDVHYKVLNALDYGVPQKRERIIICGFRKKVDFDFPPPIPREERKTVADIIDVDAEHDKSLFVRPSIRQSRLERLKDKKFPRPYISHENVAGSITPHTFSCALRAGASANYILINDERRPSAREMLRIQGFPDEFKIVVPYSQIKHQTGNSVAVPVIRAVAKEVVSHLKECED